MTGLISTALPASAAKMSPAHLKAVKARSKLMQRQVGYASMLLKLNLVETTAIATMATDGARSYLNPDWVMAKSEKELEGVLLHEALHVVWEHPLRKGNRNHNVFNIACDLAINGFLVYTAGISLPEDGIWDRQYLNMTAEAIYRILINDEEKLQNAIDKIKPNCDQKPEPGSGGSEEYPQSKPKNEEENSSGEIFTPPKTGQKVGNIKLDDIQLPAGEVLDAQDGEGNKLSDAAIADLQTDIRRTVSLSDKLEKAMSKSGTSSMSSRMDALSESQVDWTEVVSPFLSSALRNKRSWSHPNRRHMWRGVYLPSKRRSGFGGDVALCIDTSGSVSQPELNSAAAEIQMMAEICRVERIRVCYCDTVVRKNEDGEWWDIFDISQGDELQLEARGGGGTRFDPPFNLLNDYTEDAEKIQAFIYFTDGWGSVSPEVEPDIPVIWCLTDNWVKEMPFGEICYVDTSKF